MGTGKTSVGQLLARKLGMDFVDMDSLIEEREGKSIPRIFSKDGEPHFRTLERAIVRELAAREGLVIGTGGGIVLDEDNVGDLSRSGLVVCLLAEPEVILERVASDTNRPLLAGDDKMSKIMALLEQRRPLYEGIPNRVDTNGLNVEEVVERILAIYGSGPDRSPDR
ncbi:MAG: shikimate kinase [Lentisphaerae bacterium]|nr:shikimate kinase [Lentisphaerota bacterium]